MGGLAHPSRWAKGKTHGSSGADSHPNPLGFYAIACYLAVIAVTAVLRVAGVSWPVVAAVLIGLVGVLLWAPTWLAPGALADFGVALATGAVVSGMFLVLGEHDTHNQNRLAAEAQQVEQALALRAQRQQATLSLREEMHQSRLSQQESAREELNLQLTVTRDLAGVDLSNDNLAGRSFDGKNLAGANLYGVNLNGGQLYRTNLTGASLNLASLRQGYLRSATLDGAVMQGSIFSDADFDEGNLSGANFGVAHLYGVVRSSNLSGAQLFDANLAGACLAHADLENTRFGGANLANADLDGADLRGSRMIFAGLPANLSGASIAGAQIDPAQRRYFRRAARVTPQLRQEVARGDRLPAHTKVGRITDVYDGQTAYVRPLGWVRLIGLTIPNLDSPYGERARSLFASAFGRRHIIRYQLGSTPREARWGGTGRRLIYAWNTQGEFVNEQLLQAGDAVRRADREEGHRYASIFDAASYVARATGKGLWTICPAPQR